MNETWKYSPILFYLFLISYCPWIYLLKYIWKKPLDDEPQQAKLCSMFFSYCISSSSAYPQFCLFHKNIFRYFSITDISWDLSNCFLENKMAAVFQSHAPAQGLLHQPILVIQLLLKINHRSSISPNALRFSEPLP